jgi:hypothetical protein
MFSGIVLAADCVKASVLNSKDEEDSNVGFVEALVSSADICPVKVGKALSLSGTVLDVLESKSTGVDVGVALSVLVWDIEISDTKLLSGEAASWVTGIAEDDVNSSDEDRSLLSVVSGLAVVSESTDSLATAMRELVASESNGKDDVFSMSSLLISVPDSGLELIGVCVAWLIVLLDKSKAIEIESVSNSESAWLVGWRFADVVSESKKLSVAASNAGDDVSWSDLRPDTVLPLGKRWSEVLDSESRVDVSERRGVLLISVNGCEVSGGSVSLDISPDPEEILCSLCKVGRVVSASTFW